MKSLSSDVCEIQARAQLWTDQDKQPQNPRPGRKIKSLDSLLNRDEENKWPLLLNALMWQLFAVSDDLTVPYKLPLITVYAMPLQLIIFIVTLKRPVKIFLFRDTSLIQDTTKYLYLHAQHCLLTSVHSLTESFKDFTFPSSYCNSLATSQITISCWGSVDLLCYDPLHFPWPQNLIMDPSFLCLQ